MLLQGETQSGNPYGSIVASPFPARSESLCHDKAEPRLLFDCGPIALAWDIYDSDFVVIEPPRSASPCGAFCQGRYAEEELIEPDSLEKPFKPSAVVTLLVGGRARFPQPEWEL